MHRRLTQGPPVTVMHNGIVREHQVIGPGYDKQRSRFASPLLPGPHFLGFEGCNFVFSGDCVKQRRIFYVGEAGTV